MMSSKRVIAVGHAALDRVYRIHAFPAKPGKIRALEHIESGGGMAANAAASVARLGGSVELWSRIGGDDAGEAIRRSLVHAGVDVAFVKAHAGARSSTAAVIVDGSGERLIVSERDHGIPMDTDWLPLERIGAAAVVLSDLNWKEATLAAFSAARASNVATVLDIDIGSGVLPSEIIALTDYAIFSSSALEEFALGTSRDDKLSGLMALGVRHAGVTLGSRGYQWRSCEAGACCQSAFKVEVVDTTGAGDAFHGAFAWAVARDYSEHDCARIAAATAALKCRKLGARAGLPTVDELAALLLDQTGAGLRGR